MKSEVLAHFPLTGLTCFALILFFTLFTSALFWVFRNGSKKYYEDASQLPLSKD